jgi:hypothetical protein
VRPIAAYKAHGFFYTREMYEKNTFKLVTTLSNAGNT